MAKGLGPFPQSFPYQTIQNPNFHEVAKQQCNYAEKATKEAETQQDLFSILMNESGNPKSSSDTKMKGLMMDSGPQSESLSPWSSLNNEECMMDVVSPHTQAQKTRTVTIPTSSVFPCKDFSKAIVVRDDSSSSQVIQIVVKGATSHKTDLGFSCNMYLSSDFNELYRACAVDLHCKVEDIFLVLLKKEANDCVRRLIINKDDKVAAVPIWEGATVTIHPWDGVRNVDPRMIELKCTMDRPDNRKITKKMKFPLSTTLLDVKKEWCHHIQRDPDTTYILVFSSMHGEAGSLTLQSAKVKNGSKVRTASLDIRDYPGHAKHGKGNSYGLRELGWNYS